jgi:hypothetical protein
MIGDTTYDIEMGRAAGFGPIGVSWGYHPASALRDAGADVVIDDFAALPLGARPRSTDLMTGWKAKRFWKTRVVQDASGWQVLLDGRPVRTPAKAAMDLPTEAMAEAIAGEWAAQGEEIDPLSMPVTRSANSAIDRVATSMARWRRCWPPMPRPISCATAPTGPGPPCDRQAEGWDPLLDWAESEFGARLVPTTGILPGAASPALRSNPVGKPCTRWMPSG